MSKIRPIIESMLNDYLCESEFKSAIEEISNSIKSEYGYEVSVTKSTLGGGEPTFFIKVFGPRKTWTNGIAMNSPLHLTFRIDTDEIEMVTFSYQVRNAKAKMRKTKIKNESDLKKKLLDYFKNNKSKFDEILGESSIIESAGSKYKIMHKTFTSAVDEAKAVAEKQGYEIDDDEWFRKVSTGPRKPSTDKTNIYTVEILKNNKPAKKALHFQVFNTGKSYELNVYVN